MADIVIVDYDAGNLRSVARAVAQADAHAVVSADPALVGGASALILPGVGAAAETMQKLRERSLVEPIRDYIASGRPFLGVCMGMQALFELSEEGGEHECLGVLPGRIVRFPRGQTVPHMGWNTVHLSAPHPVFEGVAQDSYFYFVHSYYPQPDPQPTGAAFVVGETEYAGVRFPSVVGRDNLLATQFHPEKSGPAGLRLYANFLRLAREHGTIASPITEASAARGAA